MKQEKTIKQGHRKGHKIKGFKSSHHKDESGKTEEYYDEDHDEGAITPSMDNPEASGRTVPPPSKVVTKKVNSTLENPKRRILRKQIPH
ncbi:hypothetical protein NQ314_010025 [Rhamnusium bicolor]|uniref:Uncharacterized protein n=1 Tax=Rhamnusium bicolor TaxID=1586634 RepID=A0AAV8XUQ3_9CUCU|nr:hypothetical protein NQ314_010025 [Rhamnusium bicolor]